MSRYPLVPLGEILELAIDEVVVDPAETYPIAGVYSFGRGIISRAPIAGSETKYAKLHRLRPGQLVMSRLNGWEGALAVVGARHDGHFVSQEFPAFDVRPDVAHARFVGLLARWPELWDGLLQNARGLGAQTGARRLRISADRLLATKVPLPPLDEQARIVERMDRVAVTRARAESAKDLSEALRRSTLSAALDTRSDRYPLVPLGEILELSIDEVAVDPAETYQIAGVYSFGRGVISRAPILGSATKYARLHRLHEGQLVMSRLKAWEGAVAVVGAGHHGLFVSHEFPTFLVRSDQASAAFIELLTRWPALWDRLLDRSRGIGARRERVSAERLLATKVPLPPLGEQTRIIERMDRVERLRVRLSDRAVAFAAIERSVLHRSLTGSTLS